MADLNVAAWRSNPARRLPRVEELYSTEVHDVAALPKHPYRFVKGERFRLPNGRVYVVSHNYSMGISWSTYKRVRGVNKIKGVKK